MLYHCHTSYQRAYGTVCDEVVTVTTPGDCVDVLVTDYGIAVNRCAAT